MLFRVCNALLGFRFNMLGDPAAGETTGGLGTEVIDKTGKTIVATIQTITTVILSIAAALAVIYAIYLAIIFFRADSAEKREEAKKRLIFALVGIVVCVAIILIVQFAVPEIVKLISPAEGA